MSPRTSFLPVALTPPEFVIGIDLGGTKIAGAVVSSQGRLREVHSVPTPASEGPVAVLDTVASLVRELASASDRHASAPILGIGVGTAGVVDTSTGRIVSTTQAMPGWAGTAVADGLRARLAARFGEHLPLHVQNDVDAHAAGESWLGAAAGLANVLVIAAGTGVGGSVVLDGTVLRGAHHVAGEIGHLPTPGVGALICSCGRAGHLEALGSGPALHRYYLSLGGAAESPDARDVTARAVTGDGIARQAVHDSAAAVGRATAAVVTVLDPDVVVFTGGMALSGQLWWDAMETTLRAELIEPLAGIRVLRAKLGNNAAIIGAARSAWDLVEGRT